MAGQTRHSEPVSAVAHPPALGRRLPHFVDRTLFGYAVVIIVAGWSFGGWHIWRERGETITRSDAEMTTIAIGIAQHVEAMLHDGIGAARAAVNLIEARGGLSVLTDSDVQGIMTATLTGGDYVRALFLIDGQRDIRATRNGVELSIDTAPFMPPPIGMARDGEIWVGNPVFSPGRPDDMVLPIAIHLATGVSKPVWIGVLFGIGPIYQTYERLRFQSGVIAIVSADNRILVRVPTPPNDVRIAGQVLRIPPQSAASPGERRLVQGPSEFTGESMVYIHYAVSGYPLEVVIGRPEVVVFADWQSRAFNTLGIMAVATALFILLTLFLRRSIDDLKDRETEYRTLFDNSGVSVIILRGNGFVEANRTFYDTFRLMPEALPGLRPWDLSPEYQPDGQRSDVKAQAILKEMDATSQMSFRWTHKRMDTGEPFPCSVSLSALHSGDSRLLLSIVHDLSDLERAHAELENLNVDLERRVQRRTRDLEQANLQLAMANQELESFAASASHDLRSPLGSISGMAGLLEAELAEGRRDTAERRLGRIQESVKRMAEIIDGLLSLARMTTQEGHFEPVDLTALAVAVEAELRQSHPHHPVTFECDPGLEVHADPRLMRTVLSNLLANAWKYTGQNGDPRIRLTRIVRENGTHEYILEDNGVGFDMRYAEKLFKPFRRLHSAEQFPGIGLGLATVARIIRRYGGQIWAESRPGEGAAFHFTLPAADPRVRTQPERAEDAA